MNDAALIEIVAQAIFANNKEASRRTWEDCDDFARNIYLDDARAAINAIREHGGFAEPERPYGEL